MDVQLYSLVTSIFYISDKHFYFKISIQIVKTGSTLVRTPAHFSCSYIKRITRFKTFARESANQEKKWINYWNGLRQLFQHSCLSTVVLLNILSWIIQVMWSVRMTNTPEDRTFFFFSIAYMNIYEDCFIGPHCRIFSFLYSTEGWSLLNYLVV